jgi:hypothetical protein
MPYDPNTILPNFGAGQPGGVASTPRYGTGPGDLGMGDLMGVTGVSGQPSMGYPAMAPPAMSMATPSQPRVLRSPAPAAPLPPVRPNLNVPVGQVAQSGTGSLWDALRALFSGQPRAQNQGMTAMLNTPRSTDALGNPFNRF